ncbi:MAG: glycosyltransferase [Rhodospirillales bacterium]|nr:glycosyltransferase [Rhodospirillales bacterium]
MPIGLVIADPNCSSVLGHYFEYDAAVGNAARAAGRRAVVLARRDVDPEIARQAGAVPTFRQDIWVGAGGGGARARLQANFAFLADLLRGIRRLRLAPDAVVFVHTFVQTQILALALLPLLFVFRPRVRFVYLLRYQPDFYRGPLSRLSLRLLERLAAWRGIRLTSDSERLASELEELTTLPVEVQPIPHTPPPRRDAPAGRDARCHFVSLGNARDEKGMFEILLAIRMLAREGGLADCRFTLQCNDAQPDVAAAIAAFAADLPENCTLLYEKLSSEQYYDILWDSDVVLLPYWRSIYASRTSGVFMESLSAGRPVIATRDTWMADELRHYGAGVLCDDRDPAALCAAMRAAIAGRAALARQAEAGRAAWLAVHNGAALVADLFAQDRRAPALPVERAAVVYPFADLAEGHSGASRRCSLLLDYLAPSCKAVHASQGGSHPVERRGNITIEGLGQPSRASRLLRGVLHVVWKATPQSWRRHEWLVWEYLRLRLDGPMRRRLRRVIARSDVVFLEYPFWAPVVAPLAHRLGRKVILSTYDVLAEQVTGAGLLRRLAWGMEVRALRRADHVVTVSPVDQALLAAHGIAAVLSPNPTDARLFGLDALPQPRAVVTELYDVTLPGDDFVLFVGSRHEPNLIAVERLRDLAAELARLPGQRRIGVVVAGRCAEPACEGNFLALGRVDDELLLALYGAARVVVIPLPFGTGSSLKTVEAMAAGVTVLGTAVAFRGLAITDGIDAIVEDAPDRFAARLAGLLADADRARKIAVAGREFATAYDYRHCYAPYRELAKLAPVAAVPSEAALEPVLIGLAHRAMRRGQADLANSLLAGIADRDVAASILALPVPIAGMSAAPAMPGKDVLWQSFHAREYGRVIQVAEALLADRRRDGELHFMLAQSLHNSGGDTARVHAEYVAAARDGFDLFWVRVGLARLETELGHQRRAAWHNLRAFAVRPWGRAGRDVLGAALRSVLRAVRADIRAVFLAAGRAAVARTAVAPIGRAAPDAARVEVPPPARAVPIAPTPRLWGMFHAGQFVDVVSLAPDGPLTGEFHFLLAQSLHNGGLDRQAALRHYAAAMAAGYDRYWTLAGRARLRRELGQRWPAARDYLLAALARPWSREAPCLLRQAGSVLFQRRWPVPPSAEWLAARERLWAMFNAGDMRGVVALAQTLPPDACPNGELDFVLAQSLHNAAIDLPGALRHYDRALARGCTRRWAWAERARLRRDLGQRWPAARDFVLATLARPWSREAPLRPIWLLLRNRSPAVTDRSLGP